MKRTSLVLVALLFAACGGDAQPAGPTGVVDTTLPPATCPSGAITGQGDGPDYLNVSDSHALAVAGGLPDSAPVFLGSAAGAVAPEVMVGLVYTGCASLGGDSNFEEMAWSNGIGLLLVSWSEWPRVADPSTGAFGGTATQAGVVQVSTIETGTEDSRMRVVRLFDGLKVVSVSTYGLTTMGIDQVEDLAWVVYDGLPVDMSGAGAVGSTVDDVLAIVRSDQRTVSDATPLAAVSPFTSRAGMAHMSYTAVVDGTEVTLFDFGVPEVARRAALMVSLDGYTIAHQPHPWSGPPHFWLEGRVLILYQGESESFLEFMSSEFGSPLAGVVAG